VLAVGEWLAALNARQGRYLFPSRFGGKPHLSTRQYARIVHRWEEPPGSIARHTARTLCAERSRHLQEDRQSTTVQLLLGHTKLESTERYLGIEVDDALSISEQVEL
jgi:integrase